VVAAVVIALFLNFIVATEGVVGGYLFSVFVQHADPGAYASSLTLVTGVPELVISIVKSVAFGLIAGLVACYLGLNVKGGPKGVGESVNQSVVYSVATLEFVNLLLTTFQFKILS
jgi:phospholipid/cholesterol/gamma-HCH transport system permease protein